MTFVSVLHFTLVSSLLTPRKKISEGRSNNNDATKKDEKRKDKS